MDKSFHEKWWPLHLRAVRGEALSAEEKTLYASGLAQLDSEERFPGQGARLQQAREEIQRLSGDNARLQQKRAELEAEMHALDVLLARKKQPV